MKHQHIIQRCEIKQKRERKKDEERGKNKRFDEEKEEPTSSGENVREARLAAAAEGSGFIREQTASWQTISLTLDS